MHRIGVRCSAECSTVSTPGGEHVSTTLYACVARASHGHANNIILFESHNVYYYVV